MALQAYFWKVAVLLLAVATPATARSANKTLEAHQAEVEAKNDAEAAAAARQAKMAAVDKVVSMLEGLQSQVLADGEAEAATYNKFSCFCKDITADKTEAIETGKDSQSTLTATINELSQKRDELDTDISKILEEIKVAEGEIKEAEHKRAEELKVYETNSADLMSALEGLENAIKVLKASKTPSLLEFQSVAKTVQRAALLADALSLGGSSSSTVVAFLQQAPEVNMEDYKFHSDEIIGELEKLLKDFTNEKNEVDAEEVKSVAAFKALMQEKTDYVKAKNLELEGSQKEKEHTIGQIGEASAELTTVSATLLDDKQYLKELAQVCKDKALTWDQRSKVRQDELSTITAAIAIVKNYVGGNTSAATIRFAQQAVTVRLAEAVAQSPQALEAVEAEAEAAEAAAGMPTSFLQRSAGRPKGIAFLEMLASRHQAAAEPAAAKSVQKVIAELFRTKGEELKSSLLLSLASRVADDPFAKVKKLIQELIERLMTEAANEANQKGWCDKATADAEQKRGLAADAIRELNGNLMELEASIKSLTEDLLVLTGEIEQLEKEVSEAEKLRAEEKAENTATVAEAKAGLEAVQSAITILKRFYATVDDAKVDLSLAQGPLDDMPDAGFKVGEAYQGAQAEAGGIVGMLEVIESDFQRTITETEKAEVEAEQDHLAFMTETGVSIATKSMAKQEKQKYLEEDSEKKIEADDELASQTEILQTSIKELLELKPVCVDTGMSYEERVGRREQEIEALNKALCILSAYAKFGPGGTGEC